MTLMTRQSWSQMISRITRLAFETASLTALIAIVNAILYAGYGHRNSAHLFCQSNVLVRSPSSTNMPCSVNFNIGKMYNHSVMVTLLSRKVGLRGSSMLRAVS